MKRLMKYCFQPDAPREATVDLKYWLFWWFLSGLRVEKLRGHAVCSVAMKRSLNDPWQPSQINAAIFAELGHG